MSVEPTAAFVLLALICAGVVAMTLMMGLVMGQLLQTLQRLNRMLPACHDALQDTADLLRRANVASRRVEQLVRTTSEVASGVATQWGALTSKASGWLARYTGRNGARSGPRRRRHR